MTDNDGNVTEHEIKKAKIGFLKLVSCISNKVTQNEYEQAMAEALAMIIMKKLKIKIEDGQTVKVSKEDLEALCVRTDGVQAPDVDQGRMPAKQGRFEIHFRNYEIHYLFLRSILRVG